MNSCFHLMHKGYIAVEFFFILSGCFIYKYSISKNSKGVLDYTISRIKKFYPPFFLMIIPTLLLTWDENAFLRTLNDLFFVSNIGIFGKGVNDTLWYLSVLVFGGGLIYAMLKHFSKISISFLLPLLVILTYTYIFNVNNGNLEFWGVDGCFYKPLIRGIAAMSLGAILCCFIKKKENKLNEYHRILDILLVFSLITWGVIVFSKESYEQYTLICSCIIITTCFIKTSIINRILNQNILTFLGGLSLEMYIIHWFLVRLLLLIRDTFLIHGAIILIVYIILLVPSSYFLRYSSKRVLEFSKMLLK